MTDRKTLKLPTPGEDAPSEAPALKKKGRGWEISESRLDVLHEQARELRRHSTPAHKALAAKFTAADLGPYAFKRHAVVGSAIVDFNCHNLGLAIAIDEEGQNEVLATRRDKSMEAVGIKLLRIPAADILNDIDAVLANLTQVMRERIADKQKARRAHGDQMRAGRGTGRPEGRGPTRNRT